MVRVRELFFIILEFFVFEAPIDIFDGRADGEKEARKTEQFARIDAFAAALYALDHTFGDVRGFLHWEWALSDLLVLALDRLFEESRVRGDGI